MLHENSPGTLAGISEGGDEEGDTPKRNRATTENTAEKHHFDREILWQNLDDGGSISPTDEVSCKIQKTRYRSRVGTR